MEVYPKKFIKYNTTEYFIYTIKIGSVTCTVEDLSTNK